MVGVPATTDIAVLLGFLAHLRNHWIAGHRGKEAIDIDRTKSLGEADMLIGCEALVAKEDDAIFPKGTPDLGECLVADRCRQINSADLGADRAR
jgi:hypothetical protein